jgi:hypothetical protein
MVNFEMCNEMKIVEKKKWACNSPNHHSSIYEQSQTTRREGKKKANDDDEYLIDKKSQLGHEKTGG